MGGFGAMADLGRGKYLLGDRVGEGGMAEVFRATRVGEAGFAKPVAIKRVRPEFSSDPRFAAMFEQEARLAARLDHRNIISVLDVTRDEANGLCLVMELIDGVDLARLLQIGPLPVAVAAFIEAEILKALAYAHGFTDEAHPHGLVHRDVSPQNVLLSSHGEVKLIDFGIARAMDVALDAHTVTVKGKPGYLSPEQLSHSIIDARSDLFAAGTVLHEMLTGHVLFEGAHMGEVAKAILVQPILPPSAANREVPASLDRVCLRLVERDRERRFQRAEEALEALSATGLIPAEGDRLLARLIRDRVGAPRAPSPAVAPPVNLPPFGGGRRETAAFEPAQPPANRIGLVPDAHTEPAMAAPVAAQNEADLGSSSDNAVIGGHTQLLRTPLEDLARGEVKIPPPATTDATVLTAIPITPKESVPSPEIMPGEDATMLNLPPRRPAVEVQVRPVVGPQAHAGPRITPAAAEHAALPHRERPGGPPGSGPVVAPLGHSASVPRVVPPAGASRRTQRIQTGLFAALAVLLAAALLLFVVLLLRRG